MAHQLMARALTIPGASVHWYDKPGGNLMNNAIFTLFCGGSLLVLSPIRIVCLDPVDMRKQRKMGHITIVGPSTRTVKSHLNSMLNNENLGDHVAGFPSLAFVISSSWLLLVTPKKKTSTIFYADCWCIFSNILSSSW